MEKSNIKLFRIMDGEGYSESELNDRDYLRDRIETILEWSDTVVDDEYIYDILIPLYLDRIN